MARRHPLLLLVAAALAAACGEVTEDSPRWTCFNPSSQPFCQCARTDAGAPDGASLHACEGLQCCFASSNVCTCYGLTSLITDCSLIQGNGERVDACPPK